MVNSLITAIHEGGKMARNKTDRASLTRRSFVKGAAAVAALGGLSGCANAGLGNGGEGAQGVS